MATWTVVVPNGKHELSVDELQQWAMVRKIQHDTRVVDERGEAWNASQIPGVFSRREWLIALLLSILLGSLGVDRFYVGKVGTGILKLLTFGGLGVWTIIDVVFVALRRFDDKQGLPLR